MRFTRAIVRPPGANFARGLTTASHLGAPDYALALRQHAAYCEALERCGLELIQLDADLRFPDSTFVEDTAILGADVLEKRFAVIARPGDPARLGEEAEIRQALRSLIDEVEEIAAPGTVDGGDICEAGSHYFLGVSKRTNEAGARQLSAILARQGCTSEVVDVRELPGILHLKSGVSYLGGRKIVAIASLAGAFAGYDVIEVEPGEEYAANCVRVNDSVLVPAGYARTSAAIHGLGFEVIELEMSEFQKMDGGLSCLSLRF